MVAGNNPLTVVHVAKDVRVVDRDALFLDLKEYAKHEAVNVIYCDVIPLTPILFR